MSEINTGSPQDQHGYGPDYIQENAVENESVTNDAVAGETVLPGIGEGNSGPTGGAEREARPIYDEHDPQTEEPVELGEDDDRSTPPVR